MLKIVAEFIRLNFSTRLDPKPDGRYDQHFHSVAEILRKNRCPVDYDYLVIPRSDELTKSIKAMTSGICSTSAAIFSVASLTVRPSRKRIR